MDTAIPMRPHFPGIPHPRRSTPLVILVVAAVVVAGCEASPAPTLSPVRASASPAALATAAATPAFTPTSAPTPLATPTPPAASAAPGSTGDGPLVPGAIAVTVTDGLRVRSLPGVAEDSLRYEPLLAHGTQLVVEAGPVEASGYTWFRVAPVGVTLMDGLQDGWVAVADHDGTPWVALSADPTPGFELASATLASPGGSRADARSQAAAVNAFGVDLYRRMLRDPALGLAGKGVAMSPVSIATALAMARAGARGETATQMDAVLHVPGWNRLGTGLSALDAVLRSRDASWKDYEEEGQAHQLALRTANMAFAQRGYPIEPAYLARIGRTFGSGVGLVDYIGDADAARQAINGWVGRQTLGRIPDLLGQPDVTSATRIVLVNAIYLKAEWALPFDPDLTRSRAFTTAHGTQVNVPTMDQAGHQQIPLATGDGWQAIELPYRGERGTPLSMTLILPDDLGTFERSLTTPGLDVVARRLGAELERLGVVTYKAGHQTEADCGTYPYSARVLLPKFGVDTRAGLVPSLKALGMRLAFEPGADFTGITATDRLHIGMVIHQANIDVDEEGTEAAAATAVGMDTTGGCGQPVPRLVRTIRFNRPFMYVLRDTQTGAILFMGRVTDPTVR